MPEHQHDYLRRGRKVWLPGGLMCIFGDKSADRLCHWISSEGITCSYWLVFTSNCVRTQPQQEISDNRWRIDSLQKMGKVDVLNPDREEITSNVFKTLKNQVNRLSVTRGSCPDALQRAGITQKGKMKARRDLATLKAGPDKIVPRVKRDNGDRTELCQYLVPFGQMILIRKGYHTTKPVTIGLDSLHYTFFCCKNQ